MAGFTIPNAPDTDKSTLDQAEPDRVDFEVLGNRRKGVVSGAAVTAVSGNTVAVASGTINYEGADYSLSADGAYALSSAPTSGNRFDLPPTHCFQHFLLLMFCLLLYCAEQMSPLSLTTLLTRGLSLHQPPLRPLIGLT
mgnify:CR=1 FL=1